MRTAVLEALVDDPTIRAVRRLLAVGAGLALLALAAWLALALATWTVTDPSLTHATSAPVRNWMGPAGAAVADPAMQLFGLAAPLVFLPLLVWGVRLVAHRPAGITFGRMALLLPALALAPAAFATLPPPASWPLPFGLGGILGDAVVDGIAAFAGAAAGWQRGLVAGLVGLLAFTLLARTLRPPRACEAPADLSHGIRIHPVDGEDGAPLYGYDDGEEEAADAGAGGRLAALWGAVEHTILSFRAQRRRRPARTAGPVLHRADESVMGSRLRAALHFAGGEIADRAAAFRRGGGERGSRDPAFADAEASRDQPYDDGEDGADAEGELPLDVDDREAGTSAWPAVFRRRAVRSRAPEADEPVPAPSSRVELPVRQVKPGRRMLREAQPSFLDVPEYAFPSLHLLTAPPPPKRGDEADVESLEQNARLLEGVLEDFGVRGEIFNVRPGPVVTLYELEPAPGIKSSRVIGLADDIARSMSAISARVAVIPGKNAIGIELPNHRRITVYLRELLGSADFERTKARLPLCLGKTIGGEAVIADLTRMPHLLVAGTTGSGKSVSINTMILSLLYRLRPEDCRLIMIDPKMLELSIYEGIPHLLTPVVTDPKKAVVALKWAVREMEERYRKMSKLGVRNVDGYNARLREAEKKREPLTRIVQTGFDRDTGEAIFEQETLELEPMPYIVVIVDEMADLMMVAGKDIEGAIQRLAQMARAAGIHLIMATQRPSVDVITGTIKANFPTRISFQVTSKIDSRTILGEMGAEQLLGQGDMLYMAGGGRIQRVHGPFVADEEVEEIVAHLKRQGAPDYHGEITEDEDEDDGGEGTADGLDGLSESEDLYDRAVAVVLRDRKASTSYVQRRLQIGYNRAASLIERMEKEGVVGPANHAGKREILVDTGEE